MLTGAQAWIWRCLLYLTLSTLLSGCVSQQRLDQETVAATSVPAHRNTTIALLGGTGLVGGHILKQALADGYQLRVLSRSPQKFDYLGDRITVIVGDARDLEVIRRLVQGSDVIISAIGPGSKSSPRLNSTVSSNVLDAMAPGNGQRYLVVSGAGVTAPTDDLSFTGWMVRQLALIRYPTLLQDRQLEYSLLASSEHNWTVARCPLIESKEASTSASVSLSTPGGYTLTAGSLARFLLEEISEPGYKRTAPFVYGGSD